MGKGFFVKFEDEYGNSRTIYANANNEYEAKMIALSKAQNCINHRNAFEAFCGNTMISNIYQKRNVYDNEYMDFDEHPWK